MVAGLSFVALILSEISRMLGIAPCPFLEVLGNITLSTT